MNKVLFRSLVCSWMAAAIIVGLSLVYQVGAAEVQTNVLEAIALLRQTAAPATPEAAHTLRGNPDFRNAWNAIADSGAPGMAALKTALSSAKESESVFIVAGGALLWRMGGLDEAKNIADLWTKYRIPSGFGSPVLHATAYAAARTRDPRALPVIFAVLRDTDAVIDVPRAGISLAWPETLDFVWDAYGPDGRETLAKALAESMDRDFQASAAWLLAKDGYVEALPSIRAIAYSEDRGIARETAIRALGILGHPDDFTPLACGLETLGGFILGPDEIALAEAYIDALAEYGDMRGARVIKTFLDAAGNEPLRRRAWSLFANLLTPESLAYLRKDADSYQGDAKEEWDATLERLFDSIGVTPEEYDAMSPEKQQEALGGFRARIEDAFTPRPDEKPLDKTWLQSRLEKLRAGKRLLATDSGEADFTMPRRFLAAATPSDIPAILEARAVVAGRLTEDALADMDVLSAMAIRIARASYRQVPGLSDEVKSR